MPSREVIQVSIPNGTSVSNVVTVGSGEIVGIIMPAAWTAADITFESTLLDGTTFGQVFDDANAAIKATSPAAGAIVNFRRGTAPRFVGPFRLRSGTVAAAVNQGGTRVVGVVISRGDRGAG